MMIQLALILYIFKVCWLQFTTCNVMSVCKRIDPQNYNLKNVQEQCSGQTVFFQEKGTKGDKGENATFNSTRLKTAESQIQKLESKIYSCNIRKIEKKNYIYRINSCVLLIFLNRQKNVKGMKLTSTFYNENQTIKHQALHNIMEIFCRVKKI